MGPHPERYKNLSWHGTDIGGFCEYHLNVCREFLFGIFVNDAGVVEIGIHMMNVIAPASYYLPLSKCFPGHCVHREQW